MTQRLCIYVVYSMQIIYTPRGVMIKSIFLSRIINMIRLSDYNISAVTIVVFTCDGTSNF